MGFFPKLLITLGAILIILGIAWQVLGRFIPLGKLPGDILIKGENSTFYFPIVTCLVISVLLSLIFFILGRFR
ncbi:hypothetical protein BTS2_2804 [Bacillus sp. TS-2]|nr:hypothetical protein BTS2_2804 [Bacillus sp. TS-2]